jgi:hypothetical protein
MTHLRAAEKDLKLAGACVRAVIRGEDGIDAVIGGIIIADFLLNFRMP